MAGAVPVAPLPLPLAVALSLVVCLHLHRCAASPADFHQFIPLPESALDAEEPEPTESDLAELADILTGLLIQDPWDEVGDPLVYIAGDGDPPEEAQGLLGEAEAAGAEAVLPAPLKRSRYYRRYPWKRQNGNYDPDGYICNPSKDDVYQLLVAIHESRHGRDRTVSFCNRRRPARAIFTNIRFLGRRK